MPEQTYGLRERAASEASSCSERKLAAWPFGGSGRHVSCVRKAKSRAALPRTWVKPPLGAALPSRTLTPRGRSGSACCEVRHWSPRRSGTPRSVSLTIGPLHALVGLHWTPAGVRNLSPHGAELRCAGGTTFSWCVSKRACHLEAQPRARCVAILVALHSTNQRAVEQGIEADERRGKLGALAAYPGVRPTRRLGERTGIALSSVRGWLMKAFNVVVERDPDTGTYVGYVPGWPGAHTQGDTLDELQRNLQEVTRYAPRGR